MMAAPPSRSHFESELINNNSTGVNGSKRYSDKDMDGSLRVSSASTETTATSATNSILNMENTSSKIEDHIMEDNSEDLQRASTLSMPELHTRSLQQLTHPPQEPVESVARMPDPEPDVDSEILRIAQQLDNPTEPTPMHEDGDKKPAAKPNKSNLATKRSPSRSPKGSVTFADLPAGKAVAPDLVQDDDKEEDQKPAAKPTNNLARPAPLSDKQRSQSDGSGSAPPTIPTPRGRGLRGRRQPQTAQDRSNRRKQIMQQTTDNNINSDASNHSQNSRSPTRSTPTTPTNNTRRLVSPADAAMEPSMWVNPPLAANKKPPAATTAATTAAARPLPGDSLLGQARAPAAPGDNLATQSPTRPATRPRIIRPLSQRGSDKSANPPPAAYATASNNGDQEMTNLSEKQRARRQQQTMPANIRPGAYKEIPGRGLVRNNTLRFSIMTSIANKKRSLRKMFSSRRNTFSTANANSQRNIITGSGAMDVSNQTDGFRNRRAVQQQGQSNRDAFQRTASARSVASAVSIPSVLVDETTSGDSRRYLGNISHRSLSEAKQGGLCVARPVYQREASTLEALCIIPGDLAVAVALDQELNQTCQDNAEARLEALSGGSPPPPPPPPQTPSSSDRKRTRDKARRLMGKAVKMIKDTPNKALKSIKETPKALNRKGLQGLFRRSKSRRKSAVEMRMSKTQSTAKLKMTEPPSTAVRRHSF